MVDEAVVFFSVNSASSTAAKVISLLQLVQRDGNDVALLTRTEAAHPLTGAKDGKYGDIH
jgi:hypothetical protein